MRKSGEIYYKEIRLIGQRKVLRKRRYSETEENILNAVKKLKPEFKGTLYDAFNILRIRGPKTRQFILQVIATEKGLRGKEWRRFWKRPLHYNLKTGKLERVRRMHKFKL
ncbi:MAG: hypothetical protein AB1467_06330 [Candidatus Diapherotrites archaeon]